MKTVRQNQTEMNNSLNVVLLKMHQFLRVKSLSGLNFCARHVSKVSYSNLQHQHLLLSPCWTASSNIKDPDLKSYILAVKEATSWSKLTSNGSRCSVREVEATKASNRGHEVKVTRDGPRATNTYTRITKGGRATSTAAQKLSPRWSLPTPLQSINRRPWSREQEGEGKLLSKEP